MSGKGGEQERERGDTCEQADCALPWHQLSSQLPALLSSLATGLPLVRSDTAHPKQPNNDRVQHSVTPQLIACLAQTIIHIPRLWPSSLFDMFSQQNRIYKPSRVEFMPRSTDPSSTSFNSCHAFCRLLQHQIRHPMAFFTSRQHTRKQYPNPFIRWNSVLLHRPKDTSRTKRPSSSCKCSKKM